MRHGSKKRFICSTASMVCTDEKFLEGFGNRRHTLERRRLSKTEASVNQASWDVHRYQGQVRKTAGETHIYAFDFLLYQGHLNDLE